MRIFESINLSLLGLFIKDSEDRDDPEVRAKYGLLAGWTRERSACPKNLAGTIRNNRHRTNQTPRTIPTSTVRPDEMNTTIRERGDEILHQRTLAEHCVAPEASVNALAQWECVVVKHIL